jgi:putative redox protein
VECDKRQGVVELPSGRKLDTGFFADIKRYDIRQRVRDMRKPLLVMHGGADELVPVEDAHQIYNAAGEPRKLEIVEGADHAFSGILWQERLFKSVLEWFERYL